MSAPPDGNAGRRITDAPDKIVGFLKRTMFERVEISPGVVWWRRGGWVGSWDEAPEEFLNQAATERAQLEKENAKLRDVSNPVANQVMEFLLHYSGMAVVGIVAYQGQIIEFAGELGPTYSKVASVVVGVVVFWAGHKYMAKKNSQQAAETVAKEMVVGQDRRQP